ncbi:MAG: tetratricopeptide repeat protein [Bacteroidia bacterium]|nr:tetratricopeptide repeat protein [Bacteroidia bacterium]
MTKKKQQIGKPSGNASSARPTGMTMTPLRWAALAAVLLVIVVVYWDMFSASFINYDDDVYVTENPLITSLNWDNIKALFSGYYRNQYSPVAMFLMAVQISLFGLTAALPFKIVSVLLHAANALLVFLTVRRLSGRFDYAWITSLFFAVHPMQVESVAWLTASMKIGAYTFFFLLALLLYVRYVDTKRLLYYWLSLFVFLLSCFSKEQAIALAVTLPLVDYLRGRAVFSRAVLLEKLPFAIIAVIFGLATMTVVEEMQGGTPAYAYYTAVDRLIFTSYALASYVIKMILPMQLSAFYTYPLRDAIPGWYYVTPIIALAVGAALYAAWKRNNKMVVFGILFFLFNIFLTLLSQVLSVRDVIMADRYVYLPAIGFFLILAHFAQKLLAAKKLAPEIVYGVLGLAAVVYAGTAYVRTTVWNNSISIFTDVIEKGQLENNRYNPYLALAHTNRGVARRAAGDRDGALEDYNTAITINPAHANAWLNRGNVYFYSGRLAEAVEDYNTALKHQDDNPKTYSGRGAAYAQLGKPDLALADLNKALQLSPDFLDARQNRVLLYFDMQRNAEALQDAEYYLRFKPQDADMIHITAILLERLGRSAEAESAFNRAIMIRPGNAQFHLNRSFFYRDRGNRAAALADAERARALGMNVDESYINSLR